MGPMPRQRYPYWQKSTFGAFWYKPDPSKRPYRLALTFAAMIGGMLVLGEFLERNYMFHMTEYPSEEVRRSYEFPAPLRHKYKYLFGELDHAGPYVDPTEFHLKRNLEGPESCELHYDDHKFE